MRNGIIRIFDVLGDEQFTNEQFLDIASAHKGFISEFVFVQNSDVADLKLTYYSSECEVDFCGHGTIATMYELIKDDPKFYAKDRILIETNKKGILIVKKHRMIATMHILVFFLLSLVILRIQQQVLETVRLHFIC